MIRSLASATAGVAAALVSAPAGAGQTDTVVIQMAVQGGTDADTVGYPTMCTGEDWVVFNAVSQRNDKTVSVCVTDGDDATPNHLSYRYGRPGAPELVYPAAAARSEEAFLIRRYTRP